jgi:6-phosphogluconolactonase
MSKNNFLIDKMKRRKNVAAVSSLLAISLGLVAILGTALTTTGSAQSLNRGSSGAVYILDNSASGNNVLLYSRASDGSLTFVNSFATSGTGTGSGLASQGALVLTQDGKWLLAVDAGSSQISVFSVGSNTLTLTDTVGSQGSDPISLTVYRNWVYVLDAGSSGNIAGFTLSSGTLTYITGSTQPLSGAASPSPEQIGFTPSGSVLLVTEKATNIIDTYTVSSTGVASAPTSNPSVGAGPYGFAFTGYNTLIVSEAASDTLSSIAVSNTGALRTISGAIPTFGNAPCWIAISGNGQNVYTSNAHGGTISIFNVAYDGGLSIFSSIASSTAIPALDLAFSAHSQYLYVHDGTSITGYQVFSDGSLSTVTTVTGLPSSASGLVAS